MYLVCQHKTFKNSPSNYYNSNITKWLTANMTNWLDGNNGNNNKQGSDPVFQIGSDILNPENILGHPPFGRGHDNFYPQRKPT